MAKILVAYFSASGVTAKLAKALAEAAGANLYEIKPAVPYTQADLDWTNKKSSSTLEMNDPAFRPEIVKDNIDISVVLSGANTHDIKLLEDTLEHIVVLRPEPDEEHPQNLCLDAGYTGSGEKIQSRSYTPHIRPRGEEKKELERSSDFHVRRWVVEVTHSFLNRFRKLLVRFEKKAANYLALVQFACAMIVWRKCLRVHL